MTPKEIIDDIRNYVEMVQFQDGVFGSPVYYATEEILSYLNELSTKINTK